MDRAFRRLLRLSAWSIAVAVLAGSIATVAVPARPAQAAPVVQAIGTAQNGGGAPLTITVGTAVPAGHSIVVVAFEQNHNFAPLPATPTCSDPTNGTYAVEHTDTHILQASSRLTICAIHGVSLGAGQQITVTGEGTFTNVAVALHVSGLAANPLDRIRSTVGSGALADSGPLTSPTSQASELLIGAFGNANGSSIFTAGDNGTTVNCADSGTPTYTEAVQGGQSISTQTFAGYCLVDQVGTYRARASLTSGVWLAAIVAYRASVAAPVVTATGTTLGYTENDGARAIDTGLTVSAPDSPTLSGATVTISSGFQSGEDSLGFTNQLGISGSYNAGALTLTGNATPSDYQTALRSVTYTNSSNNPNTATRTIGFHVTDGTANPGNTATRNVAITSVNDAPAGANKTVNTLEDTPYTFATSDFGFSDVDGHTLAAVQVTTLPGAGSLTNNAVTVTPGQYVPVGDITSNRLVFTPAADAQGTGYASFTFQVQDNGGTANGGANLDPTPRTMTIDVTPVNDAPQFTIGSNQTIGEDAGTQTVTGFIPLFARGPTTATDESGQTLTFNVSVTGTTGNLSLAGTPVIDGTNGTLSYQPNPHTNGTATVEVTLTDSGSNVAPNVNTSAPQTFTITVNAVNDPPQFTLGGNQTVAEDAGPQTVTGFASGMAPGPVAATDEAAQALSPFAVSVTGTTGTLVFTAPPAINPATGALTYQTSANTSGTATVSVTLSDNGSNAAPNVNTSPPQTFTITVNPVNDPPVAAGDQYSVTAGAVATIAAPGVLANDADLDGPALTAVKVTDPGHGTVVLRPDGGFTYTPADGYAGPDSFTYKPNDSQADGNVVTVSLTIGGPTLTIGDVRIEEGDAGTKTATFTVALTPASAGPVTVQARTQDGSATAGSDYVALPPTTLTFSPGETSKPVAVTVNGDTAGESDEAFTVALSGASGAGISKATATGYIVNDDSPNPKNRSQQVTAQGTRVPGRLQVTLTAETSICPAGNTLQRIEFGDARNARVEVPGAAPGSPGGPSATPGGPNGTPGRFTLMVNGPSMTFFVQRQAPGDFRVDLVIVDTCNAAGQPFRTFVGGGVGVP